MKKDTICPLCRANERTYDKETHRFLPVCTPCYEVGKAVVYAFRNIPYIYKQCRRREDARLARAEREAERAAARAEVEARRKEAMERRAKSRTPADAAKERSDFRKSVDRFVRAAGYPIEHIDLPFDGCRRLEFRHTNNVITGTVYVYDAFPANGEVTRLQLYRADKDKH